MRKGLYAASLGSTLALAACGGEGGVMSTPPPVAAPAPSPTPTPTSTPTNTSLTNLQYSQTFTAAPAGLLAVAQRPSGQVSPASTEPANVSSISVAYDAAAQSYTVTLANYASTFRTTDRDGTASSTTLTAYKKTTGNLTENLVLFAPGPANPKLVLTYTSYGALQRLVDNGSSISVSQDYFVYGIPTAAADLPRSGTATYQTAIDGSWASDGDLRALSGTGAFSADFAAGTTNMRLVLGGVSVFSGAAKQLDTFNGAGRINAADASFTGSLAPTTSAYNGGYTGRFFGPGAAEAGASFNLTNGSGGVVAGAIVGHK